MKTGLGRAAIVGVAVLGVGLAACGDDDESGSGDSEAYCELSRTLDEQEDFPTAEQLEELRDAAPEEISDEVDLVVERFIAGIEAGDPAAVFGDAEVEEALGPIEAYDEETCGIGGDDEGEDEESSSNTEIDPDAARVDVTATDFAFAFDAPAAGPTSFVMTNEGEVSHLMLLGKLADGATLDEVLAGDDESELIVEEYESDVAGPGDEAALTVELTPGEWAMVCYLPTEDGAPHYEVGMAQAFTVA